MSDYHTPHTEEIKLERGNWWSGDSVEKLREVLNKVAGESCVMRITVSGHDWQDGRNSLRVEIEVDSSQITVKRSYTP